MLIPGLLGERGLAWLQRNPSFLYLSPYPPYPLGFCFSLSSKISLRKNTVWYIPWSAYQEVHSTTEPITWWGSQIWTRQERCWRCKGRIYDITKVLEGIHLIKKKSKNNVQWMWVWVTPTPSSLALGWVGGGVPCKLQRGFSQPQLSHSCPHFHSFFLLLSSLSSLPSSVP